MPCLKGICQIILLSGFLRCKTLAKLPGMAGNPKETNRQHEISSANQDA
jgi:hypothetical protein